LFPIRATALATGLVLLLHGPALADGPIATAATVGPSAPQPDAPAPPLPPSRPGDPADAPMVMGPCGPEKVSADGHVSTAPHGEVEAGIGTHGYRQVAGVVCQPIGENGAVTISAGQTQGDRGYRRR
jgi:hypothetical protein